MSSSSPEPSRAMLSERQVAQILERASELQTDTEHKMSIAEVETVAQEAGLDVALVRRAAVEVTRAPDPTPAPSRWTGAPSTILLHAVIPGEVPGAAYEDIVTLARRHVGEHGTHDTVGRSFSWASFTRPHGGGAQARHVIVTVTARHGATTIVVEERLTQLMWALFGGLVGGMGGGGVGLFVGPLIALGMPMLIPLGLMGWFGGAYGLARSIFRHRAAKRRNELETMLREMVDAATDHLDAHMRALPAHA